jgi:hypothetical protein
VRQDLTEVRQELAAEMSTEIISVVATVRVWQPNTSWETKRFVEDREDGSCQ